MNHFEDMNEEFCAEYGKELGNYGKELVKELISHRKGQTGVMVLRGVPGCGKNIFVEGVVSGAIKMERGSK